jgi:predicted SAM-dependent methyltransferase
MNTTNSFNQTCINIACGNCYLDDWINFDYSSVSDKVIKANLLDSLPLDDASIDIVYSSHFIEHIPKNLILNFLADTFRVLKSGGKIRLVLPDLDEMCRAYLEMRENQEHEKANFLVLEMLDQMIRQKSGGELGDYYKNIKISDDIQMKQFIYERTGETISTTLATQQKISTSSKLKKIFKFITNPSKLWTKFEPHYCYTIASLLPSAFLKQNVSFSQVGEKHTWIYDFYTLSKVLEDVGFSEVKKLSYNHSGIAGFPLIPLDMNKDGFPRKGKESMYIEATKI